MWETIETSSWKDTNSKIQERLKQVLKDDFEIFIEEQWMDVINSLDENGKELMLNILTNYPESWNELLDNLPLSNDKVLKFLKIYNKDIQINKIEATKTDIKKEIEQRKIKLDNEAYYIRNEKQITKEEFFKQAQKLKQQLNLESNPEKYKEYQTKAQKELLSWNPWLEKDPNFQNYVDAYILIQNQNEFLSQRPDLKSSFEKLSKDASTFEFYRNIKIQEYVDTNLNKLPILERDVEKAKASFVSNWEELKVSWNELRLWDQVQVFDKVTWTPQRFIEAEWWRISSEVPLETKYKYEFEKGKIKTEYDKAVKDYNTTNDWVAWVIKDIWEIEQKLKALNSWENTYDVALQRATLEEEKVNAIKQYNLLIQQRNTQEQQIKALEQNWIKIEQDEQRRIWDFQTNLSQNDERVRKSLQFFNNIWLTALNQWDFEYLMRQININPAKFWFSWEFNYDKLGNKEWWQDAYKTERQLISFWNKLLWNKEWTDSYINPDFVWDYVEWNKKDFSNQAIKAKFKRELYSSSWFRKDIFQDRFWS